MPDNGCLFLLSSGEYVELASVLWFTSISSHESQSVTPSTGPSDFNEVLGHEMDCGYFLHSVGLAMLSYLIGGRSPFVCVTFSLEGKNNLPLQDSWLNPSKLSYLQATVAK